MSANDSAYSVQRLRGGFAIVYHFEGKRVRRQLDATDRQSAEAEARRIWAGAERGAWTVGRCMTGYLETIAHKPSHSRRVDAWKAMKQFWENVDPALIDEAMCRTYRARRAPRPRSSFARSPPSSEQSGSHGDTSDEN